ncbi:MAG: hypothetical protein AAF495_06255 [Pseudomonadota bacterium]
MTKDWSEQEIAALVDGALDDPQEAERLRRLIARDPDARAYADQIGKSNDLLREAFDAPLDEPVPAAIQAAIYGEPGKVAVLERPGAVRRWVPAALAASVALAVGLSLGVFFGGSDERIIAALGNAPPDGPLHRALETLPSGTISEAGVQPMLSFHDEAGRPCREFDVIGELPDELEFGIACRSAEGRWHVEIVVTAPVTEPGPDGYATASGAAATALESMLDALGAGPAMTPEAEAEQLKNSWSDAK